MYSITKVTNDTLTDLGSHKLSLAEHSFYISLCSLKQLLAQKLFILAPNPITLRKAKIVYNSECNRVKEQTRPRGYKTFFMLKSVEHEIFSAHKR